MAEMATIKVTNHNEATVKGRFDGQDYLFPPGKAVTLSLAAATHIFALGTEDKTSALNNIGFLIPGKDTYAQALEKLDAFSFQEGRIVFDDDDLNSELAEDNPDRKAPTHPGRRPHVTGGGKAGPASAGPVGPAADTGA
jgi:hypothetical protein